MESNFEKKSVSGSLVVLQKKETAASLTKDFEPFSDDLGEVLFDSEDPSPDEHKKKDSSFPGNWADKIIMNDGARVCLGVLFVVGLLLVVILVPLSFSYVDYYDYGLKQRRSTGSVDTSRVYSRGRYSIGPDNTFIKYKADAHLDSLVGLSVFSAGGSNSSIGLSFNVDVDFTYLLNRDEIGSLHRESASTYREVIKSRTIEAIRNEAIHIPFVDYFEARKEVERNFREAVEANWDSDPPIRATLDQFHLGRIRIPESVAERQLESKVQNERNDQEALIQEAQIEREQTAVEVNRIGLEETKVLRTARAEANLLSSKAITTASQIKMDALNNGTLMLFQAAEIDGQEQRIAFSYVRTLLQRKNLTLNVEYISDENTIKTRAVGSR